MVGSTAGLVLEGDRIAPRAREWLDRPGAARIHSLYQSTVNLIDEQAEVCAVVVPPLGPGPFALLTRPASATFAAAGGFAGLLGPGAPVHKVPGGLQLGGIQVDLQGLQEWDPRPDWAGLRGSCTEVVATQLSALLERHAPAGSLAPLAGGRSAPGGQREPGGQAHDPGPGTRPDLPEALLRTLADRAGEFLSGMAASDRAALERSAGRLAGLGGGVTPAGDDFLVGAIHAIWLTRAPAAARGLTEAIVAQVAPRTHPVSAAWLKAAGRGEAAHEWHALFDAVRRGARLEPAARELIRRGHTSGADALAGFLAAWWLLATEAEIHPRLARQAEPAQNPPQKQKAAAGAAAMRDSGG